VILRHCLGVTFAACCLATLQSCNDTTTSTGPIDDVTSAVALSPAAEPGIVSAGDYATCAISLTSHVYCWGLLATEVLTPSEVANAPTFKSVSVGSEANFYACGVSTASQIYCWGINRYGRLGNGTESDPNASPRPIVTALRFTSVSAAESFACGVATTAEVWCWGGAGSGQLGNGRSNTVSPTPVRVVLPESMVAVAAGPTHACALAKSGGVYCWGSGDAVGIGTNVPVALPSHVASDLKFARIAATFNATCALTTDGIPYCWGYDEYGRFGDNSGHVAVPTAVTTRFRFISIKPGNSSVCALSKSNSAYCWGAGMPGGKPYTEPGLVSGGFRFSAVSVGRSHVCSITTNSKAYCWGDRNYGKTGLGYSYVRETPAAVAGGHTFAKIALGSGIGCGLTTASQVFCWGASYYGLLGNGSDNLVAQWSPGAVATATTFRDVDVGVAYACALSSSGAPLCWGKGPPTFTDGGAGSIPTLLNTSVRFMSVVVGETHACALTADSLAYCWGDNRFGALGTGDFLDGTSPRPVVGSHRFTRIAATEQYTCAIASDRKLYCWGSDNLARLAPFNPPELCPPTINTPRACSSTPLTAPVLADVREVGMGGGTMCIRNSNDTVLCWGAAGSGAPDLCKTDVGRTLAPCVKTPVLLKDNRVLRGFNINYALDAAGAPFRISYDNGFVLVAEVPSSPAFASLESGGAVQCGVTSTGKGYCWGWAAGGQIGDGQPAFDTLPQLVIGGVLWASL
jgi:alpha-tubulin suppressor-like RCC1 family protein